MCGAIDSLEIDYGRDADWEWEWEDFEVDLEEESAENQ